jgi:threonine 3-dehydrogenase
MIAVSVTACIYQSPLLWCIVRTALNRILLTGAGGQVGRDLIDLLSADATVVATDLHPHPGADDPPNVGWRRLDVTDAAATRDLVAEVKPDTVYHLAAVLSARGEKDPGLAYAVNQTGTWNLLEACRLGGVARLIFTSSIAVYGPDVPDPAPDDVALHPTTMYGCNKVAGELLCDYYTRRGWVDCRGVRFPGLISASIPGGGSSDYALFIYTEGVRTGSYQAFCRPDTRIPLMYMPDAIRALVEVATVPRARLGRSIYNIAAFSPRADQIAASAARVIPGLRVTWEPDPARQAILDSWPKALDDTRARRDWDWAPRFDLEAMTDDLVPRVRELVARGVDLSH